MMLRLRRPVRWRRIADDLAEAIRLTEEHACLPAEPGWSWYDALRRYDAARGTDVTGPLRNYWLTLWAPDRRRSG